MDKTKTETHIESLLTVTVCSRLLKARTKKEKCLMKSEYNNMYICKVTDNLLQLFMHNISKYTATSYVESQAKTTL